MTRILLIATVILLVLVLGAAVGGCRKGSGGKRGYLPAPRGAVPAAGA
jgi:hypothetical protein